MSFEDIRRGAGSRRATGYRPSTHRSRSRPSSSTRAGHQLILTPDRAADPGPLPAGPPDRVVLMGLDGSMINDPGDDQVLADFTVAKPGVTLADAQTIDGVVPGPASVAGQLDLATDPGAVRLYRINLPEGHRWRLGAEVTAQIDGSALLSTLTLFDAKGDPLATASHGRPGAPADPYLFAGLEPGTYYLGVSGRGNVPGQPGGYDPVTGTRGVSDYPDSRRLRST